MEFCISTCCFGERYYNQTNRLINSFDNIKDTPEIFIITDSPNSIIKRKNVFVSHINLFNSKYEIYKEDYYNFDASVKRYALLFSFQCGYNKVVLVDCDITANLNSFNNENIMRLFKKNTIGGQVTYNFSEQVNSSSRLGKRFLEYEKEFGVEFDKSLLNTMPEDCIEFISIDDWKKNSFIDVWNECIKIKDEKKLGNTPVGNIDEICFSAIYNRINVINNSDDGINILVPIHDKWY